MRDITAQIDKNTTRNECARQVSADLDESFRHGLGTLLNDLLDRKFTEAREVGQRLAAAPNAADEIRRRCGPPAVAGP